MNTWEITWIAVGIALTTATQLRVGSPVGLGEVMICTWILYAGIRLLLFGKPLLKPLVQVFFWFWIVSFIGLTLGLLIAESKTITSSGFFHDGFALTFSFLFCICFNSSVNSSKIQKRIIINNLVFSVISLSLLSFIKLPLIGAWYGGSRFTGWANNPNQIALLISMIPFLALHLLNHSRKRLTQAGYGLLIFMAVVLGIATDSDALMLCWGIGLTIIIILAAYENVLNSIKESPLSLKKINLYKYLVSVLGVLFIIILLYISYDSINSTSSNIYSKGNQGSDRVTLWKHGIEALFSSPLFGLGPGAHSGIKEPFSDFESHNTFIDWGGSSGLIGLIAYLSLLGWIGWTAWRNKSTVLVAAVISLVVFSSFHYVLRHIIFWFYLISIAHLSLNPLKDNDVLNYSTKQLKNNT